MSTESVETGGETFLKNWECEADGSTFIWRKDGATVTAELKDTGIFVDLTHEHRGQVYSNTIDTTYMMNPPENIDAITRLVQMEMAEKADMW